MKSVRREILIFIVIICSAFAVIFISSGLGLTFLVYGYPAYLLVRLLIWLAKALIRYCQRLKREKKSFLNKTTVSVGATIFAAVLAFAGYDFMLARGPAAIVIDARTFKPVEGAVALAQWSHMVLILPEGGSEALDKVQVAYSDKDGHLDIDGFWGVRIFSLQPRLTVYKPGYVLWDSRFIAPLSEQRTDFDINNRTVRLVKFEKEAARWVKEGKYGGGNCLPRQMHCSFFSLCNGGSSYKFQDIFRKNELPLLKKEKLEHRQKSKIKLEEG